MRHANLQLNIFIWLVQVFFLFSFFTADLFEFEWNGTRGSEMKCSREQIDLATSSTVAFFWFCVVDDVIIL